MKLLAILFTLLMSLGAFAETGSFFFDGTNPTGSLNLRSEETHTEYRYETRHTICHRQEVVYRRVCRQGPNRQRICENRPHYRTVSYPCTERISIPYQVKDFDVEANINISVLNSPEGARENFTFSLNQASLSINALGSKKFYIVLKSSNENVRIYGRLKVIEADYQVELVDASSLKNAISVNNLSVKNNVLTYKVGQKELSPYIGHTLQVNKAPLIGSDTTLFNRELSRGEYTLSGGTASVDLSLLGVEMTSGRHTITPKVFLKLGGRILNESQFDATEASKTLIYKIR